MLLALFCLSSASAWGIPAQWFLSGVTFDDGGTAQGSFIFDPATGTFSSVNITTTTGSTRAGATYKFISGGFVPGAGGVLIVTTGSGSQTGLPGFAMFFTPNLASVPGASADLFSGGSQEASCGDAGCTFPNAPARIVLTGRVSASILGTPTLSEWGMAIFGILLVAAGMLYLRKSESREAQA